jgi:hypothetical protein
VAIIYQDYFETYVLGQSPPFGNLHTVPFTTCTIQAGGVNGSKYAQGPLRYDDGNSYSSFTVQQSFNDVLTFFGDSILLVRGLTVSQNQPSTLINIITETDGTISVRNGHGTLLANSGDASILHGKWFVLQTNVVLTDVAGTINASVTVALDGIVIITTSGSTESPTSSLVNGAAMRLLDLLLYTDDFTLATLQSIPSYQNPGTPLIRNSQGVVEVTKLPNNAAILASQGVIEATKLPDFAKLLVSQGIIELVKGVVAPPPLTLACPILGSGVVGTPYSSSLVASGGTPPYTFAIIGGTLPPGLSLNTSTGLISGTPTTAGTFSYQAKVTDSLGAIAQITCSIVIGSVVVPLAIACPVNTTIIVGTPYSGTLVASGGTAPYTFAIISGSLPPGLTLDPSTGIISGTPTLAGTFSYTAKVTDSVANTATITCSFGTQSLVCGIGCGPKLYFWEPSYLDRPEDTYLRATDWDNAGYDGSKFLQGFLLTADTEGVIRQIRIEGDQGPVQTFSVLHSGEQTKSYSFTTPSIYSLIRAIGVDVDLWRLFKIKWIFEPAPNLASHWITQGTSHDIAGWQFLKDGYIAHISTTDLTFTITVDGVDFIYTIPNSGGIYKKDYLLFAFNALGKALKGKLFTYKVESTSDFRLFVRDCEVRVHPWAGGDYVVKQPFGDLSRIYGARI